MYMNRVTSEFDTQTQLCIIQSIRGLYLYILMYIHQKQLDRLISSVEPGKVVVVYGPRRCGKTTMLQKYIEQAKAADPKAGILFVTGEDRLVRMLWPYVG